MHEGGHQVLPVGFAVSAANLAVHLHGSTGGGNLVSHFFVPAVGLAVPVILVGIFDAPGFPGAPGEINPGIRTEIGFPQVAHERPHAEADGAGDAAGLGEPAVVMDRCVKGHQTAHGTACNAGTLPERNGPVFQIDEGLDFTEDPLEEAVKEYNLPVLAEIVGIGQGGVDPQVMGLGPVEAVGNVLKNTGLKLEEIDVLELNEAFASQSIGVVKELSRRHGVEESAIYAKTNLNGGAIAVHLLAATAAAELSANGGRRAAEQDTAPSPSEGAEAHSETDRLFRLPPPLPARWRHGQR